MRVVLLRSLQLFTLHSSLFTLFAATAPLEDIPNTAPVVTNEEDAVAMAAVGALGGAVSNKVDVEVAGVNARIVSATNALNSSLFALHSSLSNHVEATYAKRSEIPASPDLSPYALKSELPQDYLTENDITNFATRTWISAQGYATAADVSARFDLQNLAMDAATNALWAAHLAHVQRFASATNALRARMDATAAELRAQIEALEITGGNTRLWTSDATVYQDATGTVWQLVPETILTNAWTGDCTLAWGVSPWGEETDPPSGWTDGGRWLERRQDGYWELSDGTWGGTWIGTGSVYAVSITLTNNNGSVEAEHYSRTFARLVETVTNNVPIRQVAYMDSIPETSLAPATNYTDTATNEVMQAALRAVASHTHSNIVDAAGNRINADRTATVYVPGVEADPGYWMLEGPGCRLDYDESAGKWICEEYSLTLWYDSNEGKWCLVQVFYGEEEQRWEELGAEDATSLEMSYWDGANRYGMVPGIPDSARSDTLALSSEVAASTNGLPEAVAAKQAALPYPTNAIPYSAIADAPSGAPEWAVVAIDHVAYTNGMLDVYFLSTLSANTNGWPDGAAVFCRLHPAPGESYTVLDPLRLVGYGSWPTNEAQIVTWRSGTNVFVNVLVEE